MKYPESQFKILVDTLRILTKYAKIENENPSNLHFIVYQQHAPGQLHNRLCYDAKTGTIKRHGTMPVNEAFPIITEVKPEFEIYPDGCKDSHIETATKKAVKQIISESHA